MTKFSATPSRRAFLTGVAAVSLATPYLWTRRAAAAQQVLVRTPGGVFDDVKRETVYEPFREETGIEIVPVAATAAKLFAMFRSGGSELDLIDTGDSTLLELQMSGHLMPMPYAEFKYTNPDDLDPVTKREFQVGSFIYAMILAHNTKAYPVGSEPKSWVEFWDVEKFPGPRTLPGMAAGTPALEQALIADGVPIDKLYPLDIERAFESMSRIRSSIPKFWDTGALSTQLLSDNEVAMGAVWSTRAQVAADKGAPLGIQWNQNSLLVQGYGIPVGSNNVEGAVKFVDYASSPEVQARWLKQYKAIPVNQKAYAETPRELMDPETNLPWTRSKGFVLDIEWWAEHRPEVNAYWSKWIIQ
ncbi:MULTISPECIES: ABC transporter substrate-binding protein [unclassified Aurantimonas]|uniref:ABC transporter substrate-binding protein n=1 Tax=unclassified Aurantimonas TaxID=2638230 RepID=UPI002E19D4C3|nr:MULTISPECIES: ABC transporter substrate-binding protein [unclassified Aurantimonas]MEC5293400.1 ABC transporter substrate-binding protein [Aurantimonas sp. C2-3-R2]MEC5414475.1 ABC transporter substrate-binding protein [Aurantimonas sp. C2-4-R8]